MGLLRLLGPVVTLLTLTACGGGGTPGVDPTKPVSATPIVTLEMRSSSGAVVSTLDTADTYTLNATVKNSKGVVVGGQVVTFSGDAAKVRFNPPDGTALTDATTGVASVQVSVANASSSGAGTLSAAVSVAGVAAVPATLNYQIALSRGAPSINLGLRDVNNLNTRSVSASSGATAKATLLDAGGNPVAGKVVVFTGDTTLVRFNPASGQVLTDANGVASVHVSPASQAAVGAGTLKAASTVNGIGVESTFDYQLSVPNLTLQALDLGTGGLAAYGNRPVSTVALIDGSAARDVPVQVTFTASCGTVTPSAVMTDSAGRATTSYKADSPACAGNNVIITASSVGADSVSGSLSVQPAVATNLLFVSAAPERIYLAGSVGVTQAQVSFKVVDFNGNPLQNQGVRLALNNVSTGASIGTLGNATPVDVTSDGVGVVSVPVFAGSVPASLQIRAYLLGNPAVTSSSNTLTVASGRPVQSRISIAASVFAVEGWSIDGKTTQLTVSMADRQGNPVPDGTEVNFVSEGGVVVPPSCVVEGGTSQCSVSLRSGNPRPPNGRVSVLAYVPGEEDFVDANGNNVYDPGETFFDLGNAYRDDNENGNQDLGEFFVPRAGSSDCAGGVNGKFGSCDGVWGAVDVRAQAVLIFSTSGASMSVVPGTASTSGLRVDVSDLNGASMPTGTTIAAAARLPSSCAVDRVVPSVIPNTLLPTRVEVILGGTGSGCNSGDTVDVSATSPSGVVTTYSVTLP